MGPGSLLPMASGGGDRANVEVIGETPLIIACVPTSEGSMSNVLLYGNCSCTFCIVFGRGFTWALP